ncbi:MAG: SpoIIE family protein phosphatase [Chloroflexi bacterium]|nr:SpoIIE family protein phosphatase [Chloroflexota bacterium]
MSNLALAQKLDLFNDFAQYWREIVGRDLLVLSHEGEVLTYTNGARRGNWNDLLNRLSPDKPTFLIYSNQRLLTVPLFDGQQPLGYLLVFDAQEQDELLLAWGAKTIVARLVGEEALQGMTDELIGAWDQLELLYRVTQNLALTSDLMAALKSILVEIQKVVNTEDSFVLLRRPDAFDCVTGGTHGLERYLCAESLLNNLVQANHVVLCNDIPACRQIWPEAPTLLVENFLATPLMITDEDCQAALGLINKANRNFTAGDVKLLAALAQQVGTIVKNFLVHQRLIVEERLSRELEIAAEIQVSLLPTTLPQVGGLSIAVVYIPASEVGGDFYDFITVGDRQLTLIIGDVAGKGIPAAMLTSVTRTMLRVEAMRGDLPHTIIHQANNVLYQDLSRADSFVTAFVATIDTVAGTFSYASAGHAPVILWRAETKITEQLKATSPPIGIFYRGEPTRTITLKPGDTILFYTDGITEAESPEGELFGLNRLLQIVEAKAHESPETLQQCIQAEITNFRRDSLGRDDATMLVIKMLPQVEAAATKPVSPIIKTLDFAYPADTKYLVQISQEITHTCRQLPTLPSGSNANDFIYLIELAISEICTNIIQHAYGGKKGKISGQITLLNHGVHLDFYDTGVSFDPATIPEPSANPHQLIEGGYGLHIVRQIMDVVTYDYDPERGNHWHLEKFLRLT